MTNPPTPSNPQFDRQRLEGLINQDYVAVALFRGPQYVVEVANNLLCRIWGRDQADILGRPLFDILPELKGQGFEALLRGTYTTGRPYIGTESPAKLHRNGQLETVYFNFSYYPMRDNAGAITGIVVMATDATDEVIARHRAADVIAETNRERRELRRLFMQAPALIAILRGPQHIFEMANEQYVQTIGGGRSLLGKTVAEAVPEVVEQGLVRTLDRVYRTGEPFWGNEVEIFIDYERNGHPHPFYFNFIYQPTVDSHQKVNGIFVHAVDVTSQVYARRRSEDLSVQLEAIYENMPDGLLIASPGAGITKINSAALAMLGFNRDDEVKDVASMFQATNVRYPDTGEPVPPSDSALARALRGQTVQYEVMITNHQTGQDRTFRVAAAPIRDTQGAIVNAVSVMTDITERKQLERQKDDFIGIATHELKTPVTSLKTFAQLLQRRFVKAHDDASADTMGKIITQVDKLTGLIGDLLDVTKIDAGKLQIQPREVDFDAFVADVVSSMQLTSRRHQLVIQGATRRTIRTDRDRVEQVLINLISNAIKYSPRADTVEIQIQSTSAGVQVRVRDYGIGISPDKQSQIFERFFRVSGPQMESFPGLGLGLFICSEIIKRLDGRIWVDSDGHRGSTFGFELPAVPNR